MRSKSLLAARLIFVAVLVHFTACQKVFDFKDFFKHGNDAAELCNIKTIFLPDHYGTSLTATFKYNKRGDPDSVLFPKDEINTGRPDLVFLYDNEGRLTDYFGPFLNGVNGYQFWYRYQYKNNRIVSDTSYWDGAYIDHSPLAYVNYIFASEYKYDADGRVIWVRQKDLTYPNNPDIIFTYTYNSEGNLIEGGGSYDQTFSNFDNKVNIHRTSPIWMFIDRDYSVNNPYTADAYNASGLPTKTRFSTEQFYFLYNFWIDNADIEYECK